MENVNDNELQELSKAMIMAMIGLDPTNEKNRELFDNALDKCKDILEKENLCLAQK